MPTGRIRASRGWRALPLPFVQPGRPIYFDGVRARILPYIFYVESAAEFDGVFFDSPGVAKVKWDPTTQAVTTEWQGWADQADFIAVLEAGLRAIKKHRSSRGLVDSRRQRALPQAEQDWVNTHWFPQALRAGLSRLALVIPESGLAMMNIEDVVSRVRGTNLDVAYFATVAEAKEWLTEEPTSAPIASAALPVS